MAWRLIQFSSTSEPWAMEASQLYTTKIKPLVPFEIVEKKSKKSQREEGPEAKLRAQHEVLLALIKKESFVVLFDVSGRKLSSEQFAEVLRPRFECRTLDTIFVIGGAYGFSDETRQLAHLKISFGTMTMNHLVSQVVVLEQIYRALSIIKGLPYHNP